VYGRNSFRGDDLGYREAFLERAGPDTWRVSNRLRAPVRFAYGNLLADDFAVGRRTYDAIFCRNLLIYFDRSTQARAVRMLDSLLAPRGWFAVGPAEPVLLLAHGYELLKIRSGFVLRRAGSSDSVPPLAIRPPAPAVVSWREIARPAPPVRAPDPAPVDPEVALAEIQRLADAGRLREARTQGEALLAQRGASAPLLFLLGVVAEVSGDTARAEELYRKTVYLEPGHTEALAHLAARAELNGDLRAARSYRERAQRALGKEAR
jgi:chemotaxis protein methyltransferase WspC